METPESPPRETLYVFNGTRLRNSFIKAGYQNLRKLTDENELRFVLFVYDVNPRLTGELYELVKSGTRNIPVEGYKDLEITLTWKKHWDP